MRLILAFILVLSLHAEDLPTVEQLQAKIAEQQKEIERLREYVMAVEQFDSRNVAIMQAALNACIGQRPRLPVPALPIQPTPTSEATPLAAPSK